MNFANPELHRLPGTGFGDDMVVVEAAQSIVSAAADEGASWEMCERQLKALREVAGKLEPAWWKE